MYVCTNICMHAIITDDKRSHEFKESREGCMRDFGEKKGNGHLNYNLKFKKKNMINSHFVLKTESANKETHPQKF